jgi:DNA invertase Pin-like site-specific DNA recombinase
VRVVGYVRETADPQEGEAAFVQSERIRRWIAANGHQLVAVCQDIRQFGHSLGREGYRALIGIISAGQVDAVVVSALDSLSGDKIIQEIMLWDLRTRGVTVLSARAEDLEELRQPPHDQGRMLVRDVLVRIEEHAAIVSRDLGPAVLPVADAPPDVVIELIAPGEGRASS